MPAAHPAPDAITLVIPVYDGAAFLDDTLAQAWEWLQGRNASGELLVVDDGSTDATPAILAEFDAHHPGDRHCSFRALRNAVNRGKGFSLRRAFLHARHGLVLFTDADLTYPVENLAELVSALQAGADVAIGSRMHRDSRYVVAPSFFGKLFTRHALGRLFNLLARALVVPGVRDSQAGIKGFRLQAARLLAERVRLDRFSFDVELLFVARRLKLRVVECPVLFLYRKEPSTVRFARDAAAMVRDMIRIRWRGWGGDYEAAPDPAAIAAVAAGEVAPAASARAAGSPARRE